MTDLIEAAKQLRARKARRAAIVKNLKSYAEKEKKREYASGRKEFGVIQEVKIKDAFNEAVATWYGEYAPIYYERQGDTSKKSGGLYNILSLFPDENGMYDDEHPSTLLDPSGMHGDREGGDLYEKVFLSGWHGGAESGNYHPNPGIPFYRKPHPDNVRKASKNGSAGRPWVRWSRPAAWSPPASGIFAENISEIHESELESEFQRVMYEHKEKVIENVKKYAEGMGLKVTTN